MSSRLTPIGVAMGAVLLATSVAPRTAVCMPKPGPLRFISPTPAENALVTSGTTSIRLDAACTFNPNTLAVSLNGATVPAAAFLPFSACTSNRITSQTVVVNITLPNGTISSAPANLAAGGIGSFSGSGSGDGFAWNFDGGAAPATGSHVQATFAAAGRFTVRLRATDTQELAASGMDQSNLVTAERGFRAGDATPDSRLLQVEMPPDVDFVNYESGQVHPLALDATRTKLFAVNTPEGRLAIFDVQPDGSLSFAADVPVGVDPVSLAVRPGTNEVWVANHLSDTVSIVDTTAAKLIATIATGDEPTDVAFASGRAFVSLAGNQDRVKVYNAATRAQIASLDLFGDDPRALAVNAAGTEVYAVVLESGNKSTVLFEPLVTAGGGAPAPSPPRNPDLGPAPDVGLIVKFNPATGKWEDETADDWSGFVDYTLPDNDLFVLDADAPTPSVLRMASGVGTILFDVAVHPSGEVWVANTDARNLVRFESNLRGHLVATRVTKVNASNATVTGHSDLNSHINYAVTPGSPAEIATSLALPGDGVFTADGSRYYLTAFGSGKVGVLDASGAVLDRIAVGGGPSGVALNETAQRLYVLNRFDNSISVVDTVAETQVAVIGVAGASLFDPSPDVIKAGRPLLYDARITSGHGDTACATCHVFGNFDNVAWDLGNPAGAFVPYSAAPWVTFAPLGPSTSGFDPQKGPMTTQTLRGLLGLEPFHWRGDRQNFQHFNGAFVALMGMSGNCSVSGQACNESSACPSGQSCLGLTGADMDTYTDFIMTVNFPPNPLRNLDDSMPTSLTVPAQSGGGATATGNPNTGRSLFINNALDGGTFTCNQCHTLPAGTSTNLFNGNLEGESQDFKIPQLRNMYEKVGFDVIRPGLLSGDGNNIGLTAQRKGFGFIHDGAVSLTEFLAASVFTMNTQQERDVFAFMLAFPTESFPALGAQVTVNSSNKNDAGVTSTINTLIAQAESGRCDVIVKGSMGGVVKGWVYDTGTNLFEPDSTVETPIAESALRGAVAGSDVITYTGVPPGAGVRLGIDRDRDTWLDRFELASGSDPADPNSNPWKWSP